MRICLPLLIFLLPMAASAPPPPFNASSSQRPSDPYSSSDNSLTYVNQTATAVFVILLLAFLLVGFVVICIRHCSAHRLIVLPLYSSSSADAARPRRLSPRSLDQAAIDSFPVFNYSEIKHLKIGRGALTCAVCVSEFEDNERLRLLPKCDHVFHPECIDPWLASHSTCPICRANLSGKFESREVCNSTAEISEVQNHDQIAIADDENERVDTDSRERVRRLPRPHSTGHSLVRLGEDREIYALRLPEEVRRRHADRVGESDRWVFNMTLPFLSGTGSVKLTKVGVVDGEATGVGTSREFLTSMKLPFECLAGMSEKIPTRLPV